MNNNSGCPAGHTGAVGLPGVPGIWCTDKVHNKNVPANLKGWSCVFYEGPQRGCARPLSFPYYAKFSYADSFVACEECAIKKLGAAPVSPKQYRIISTSTPMNDVTCPSCRNTRCSSTETTCWWCGGKLK